MTKMRVILYNFLFAIMCFTVFAATMRAQEPKIEKVAVEKEKVFTWCPSHRRDDLPCSKIGAKIRVETTVSGRTPTALDYNYIVSGGKIEGQGSSVIWDLSEAQPGKHSITVGLGIGGLIRGETVSRKVD